MLKLTNLVSKIKSTLNLLDFPPDTVTVLTLVYNGMPYLTEAVDSILNQDTNNFKYLIIDDCSTDASYEYLSSIHDDRIILIRNQNNLGVSNSFNKALEIIDTPILIRMDQDDISLPSRVREQTIKLYQDDTLSFLCSWEHVIDEKGRWVESARNKIDNYGELLAPILLGLCPVWHPSLACKTTSLKTIGGFRDYYRRAEDYDVTARLALKRMNAYICQTFHLQVRRHAKQQSQQYLDQQKIIASLVQCNSIEFFLANKTKSKLLSSLYRRSIPTHYFAKENNLLEIFSIHREFINSVHLNLTLNIKESKSLIRIFKQRIGSGIFHLEKYKSLPTLALFIIFIFLSPQYLAFRAKNLIREIIKTT